MSTINPLKHIRHVVLAMSIVLLTQSSASATIEVFMNFGGDWINSLNSVATDAGVATFSAAERTTIQTTIETQLQQMFNGFTVNFNTTSMPTQHEIDFGATTTGNSSFGSAPFDSHNQFDGDVANVFTRNFHNAAGALQIIESSDSRAQQILELSTALSGTAAHELGHSLGLAHHHAYDDPGIDPSTYAATGGLQNSYILATGSTGLTEAGRDQSVREFSDFSKILLETTGQMNTINGVLSSNSAVATPLPLQNFLGGADVGDTTATATALTMTSSTVVANHTAAFAFSDLSSDVEVDVFSFNSIAGAAITAQVWSDLNAFTNDFDPTIRLLDTDGTTVLASNADTAYGFNTFDAGAFGNDDSFLLNIEAPTTGTYFLEVASEGNIGGDPGGLYSLVIASDNTAVPEPQSMLMMFAAGLWAGCGRRRRRKTKTQNED